MIDSSLWIDFVRRKSSSALRAQAGQWIGNSDAVMCEPVMFEVLHNAFREERPKFIAQLNTLPLLTTPKAIWFDAIELGQRCRDQGLTVSPMDLLVAAIAIHHDTEIVTFDADYTFISQAQTRLRIKLLVRDG